MRLKIRTKFILMTILIVIVACTIGTVIAFHNFVHSYEKTVSERIFAQAEGLKSLIKDVVELGLDVGELRGMSQECKKMVASIPYAKYCFITDKRGKVFYHSDLSERLKTYHDPATLKSLETSYPLVQRYYSNEKKEIYDYTIPVLGDNDGKAINYIRIGVLSDIVYKEVLRLRNFYIFLAFIIAFAASLLVYWFFNGGILRPLDQFIEGVSQFGKGNLSHQIDIKTKDEIGDLAHAVNAMATNLRKITISRDELNQEVVRRREAEEALRYEKDRAQQYLEIAGVMMVALDEKGDVVLINERGCEILGYPREEVMGKNWFSNFLPQKIVPQVKEVLARLLAGEIEILRYSENSVLTKRGEEKVILWNNSLLLDEKRKPVGVLSSGEDVTERREAEKIVVIQRDLGMVLSSTHDLSEAANYLLDAALKIEGVDCGGLYLFNKERQALDLIAHRHLDPDFAVSCKDYKSDSAELGLILQGKPIYQCDNDINASMNSFGQKQGLKSMAIIPILYKEEVVASLSLASHIYRDISLRTRHAIEMISSHFGGVVARIEAEQDLRESESRYRELVESANSMILRVDEEGTITYFNEYAQKFFGYKEKEILGKNVVGTIVPLEDDKGQNLRDMVREVCSNPEIHEFNENQNIRRNGEKVWIAWTNKAVIAKDGKKEILTIGTDITKRKEAERQLEEMFLDLQKTHKDLKEAQRQLLQSEKMAAIGQFSAGVAHEVKNPLAIILLSINSLLKKTDTLDQTILEPLEMIRNAAQRANRVVTDLLSFSRETKMELERVSIQEILDDAISISSIAFRDQKVEFKKEYPKEYITINADKILLEQVFFNLFSNAVDAIKEKGLIIVRAYLLNLVEEGEQNLIVEVIDNGEGMSKKVLSHIFEPFFTTKEEGKGSGLGLGTVYMILQRHHATIDVESKVNGGTKFTISFPLNTLA